MSSILRAGCKAIASMSWYAAPVLISSAVKACLQDQKVAKIASGTMMFFSGIGFMTKAVIRRADGGGKMTSAALGALGFGMSAAGFAQASIGLMEMFYPNQEQELQECEARVQKTIDEISQCPVTRNIWKSIQEDGEISIQCTDVDEKAGVIWGLMEKEIFVSKDLIDLGYLRSKFVNAIASIDRRKEKSDFFAHACKFTAKSFAKLMERMEWESIERTFKLGKICVDAGFWPTDWLTYQEHFQLPLRDDDWRTFDSYLKNMEKLGHTVLYEEMWQRNCGVHTGL